MSSELCRSGSVLEDRGYWDRFGPCFLKGNVAGTPVGYRVMIIGVAGTVNQVQYQFIHNDQTRSLV